MRVPILLICFVLASLACRDARAQWHYMPTPGCKDNLWIDFGAGALFRPGTNADVAVVLDGLTNEVLLDANGLTNLGTAVSPSIRFGRRCSSRGFDWDLGVSGAKWSSDYLFDTPDLASPFFPGFSPDIAIVNYNSEYIDVDFNIKRSIMPGVTIFAGPRYLSFRENMSLRTETVFDTILGPFLFQTEGNLGTSNSMIGGQVGLELFQPVGQMFTMHGFIKTAGMANSASFNETRVTTIDDPKTRRGSKNNASFIGQTGGRVICDLVPRTFSTYVGYEATWIDGVALGPTQFFDQDTTEVFTKNTLFWHGVTFGINISF